MSGVRVVENTIGDLADYLGAVPRRLAVTLPRVVARNAKEGNRLAKRNAQGTSGAHGKWYPDRFDAEPIGPMTWEYGPSGHPQGEMSGFETGSRNQPAHLDLARSFDVQAPKFVDDVLDEVDKAFR